ncbi:PREDICTED: F-box/kelch-repeat protein At3g06240-like [Prunus mume]|uniref:F-box/kelch-repeat protein At3g06240-like n=1 Tax=Prunus mume TaxID=102107 RepID=A0ABM0P917_PRUMU|nr:PREDICTED: F-box/kelch-repeat protein At3g06240-like [Prunus mume]
MANTTLPDDVIVHVLLRLPVKSLIRFSCVSKRWRSLVISDPEFAQSHFKLASKQKTINRRLLLSTDSQLESLDLEAPSFGDKNSVRKLVSPFKLDDGAKILGSCNGLVCAIGVHEKFYIWNPSTGLSKTLSNKGSFGLWPRTEMPILHNCYYGFGYVSAIDDYKLAVATDLGEVAIFSLRANVWKRMKGPDDQSIDMQTVNGTLLNEALHWLPSHQLYMFAFDLAKEESRKVPLPVTWELDDMPIQYLGLLEGCLCALQHKSCDCDSIDFWVMTEYGVLESWTKLFKFKIFGPPERPRGLRTVFISESGSVVVRKYRSRDMELIRIEKKEDKLNDKNDKVVVWGDRYTLKWGCEINVGYDETLLWVGG